MDLAIATLRDQIAGEARALFRPGPRMVDEVECALSVLLAILFAHLLGASNVSWAAFSGYMVMRGHFSESLLRGILRIVGTVVGAAIGLIVTPLVLPSPWWVALASLIVGGASLYGALTGRRAYAWLFVGLTFEMILLDKLEHPERALIGFATTRILEVLAGTGACLLVSAASSRTARRQWPSPFPPAIAPRLGWHRHAARHTLQAMAAVAILPFLWSVFRIPSLAQSAVTIMAVMLVPATSLGASGLVPVSVRLVLRIAGCLAGSALAGAFLFAAGGNPAVLIAGTCIGVVIGRHIENGRTTIVYLGTQFTLAILVTLVPDSYADAAIAPAVERLTGILIGMALLEPVLLASHWAVPLAPASRQAGEGGTEAGRE